MHQHPPKTPLVRSTSAANASQVVSSRALIAYATRTPSVSMPAVDDFPSPGPSLVCTDERKDGTMPALTPMLWFDTEAEQAAEFYTSVFPGSKIVEVTRYGSAGPRPEGMVMTVEFELDARRSSRSTADPTSRSARRSPS
jgi:hypothetical protein